MGRPPHPAARRHDWLAPGADIRPDARSRTDRAQRGAALAAVPPTSDDV